MRGYCTPFLLPVRVHDPRFNITYITYILSIIFTGERYIDDHVQAQQRTIEFLCGQHSKIRKWRKDNLQGRG